MQFMDTLSIHTCAARENTQLLRIGQAENMDLCIGSSSGNKSIFRSVKPANRVQLLIQCGSDGRLFRLVGMRERINKSIPGRLKTRKFGTATKNQIARYAFCDMTTAEDVQQSSETELLLQTIVFLDAI
jgi:hypothetical protein